MPAEKIYSSAGDIDVRVAWGSNRDGVVEVATLVRQTTEFDPTKRVIKIVNEWLAEAGESQIDLDVVNRKIRAKREAAGEIHGDAYFDGYHATIASWADLNDLIRVLKRARDAVFGRPE